MTGQQVNFCRYIGSGRLETMKISVEWLREYVEYEDSLERLEEIFTNVGFPVEGREQVGDDWMLDLEITSNRPDCLGHIGLAREVSAVTGAAFRMPSVEFSEHGRDVTEWTSVADEAPQLCGRYTARVIDKVKVGPSPDWMRRRLETIGLRSISNVVDITNYVMMEIGQPLHSFDYNKLSENRIVVRTAKPGEQIETIDQTKCPLTPDMLVIADARNAVAVAGVMGGLASEVSNDTHTILLESAHFAPLSIRRTARALALNSDSSFRFERNVDMEMVQWASRRAAALLEELAEGQVAPGVIDVAPGMQKMPKVEMRLSRLKTLIGIDFDSKYVIKLFERLGLSPESDANGIVTCTIPSWRSDLTREADLIEEVIRIHGYGHVPTEPKIHITVKTPDILQQTRTKVSQALNGCGFFEAINVSFVEDKYLELFSESDFEPLRVKDMSRKSNNALRMSLGPSLLGTRKRNQDADNGRCDLYELAAVYRPANGPGLPQEKMQLGLITDSDFRHLRGAIEAVLAKLDRQVKLDCRPREVLWAGRGEGAELVIGDRVIGQIGRISAKIVEAFDLDHELCLAQIDFDQLVQLEGEGARLEPIIRFPSITRDLSLVLGEQVRWAAIEEVILQLGIDDLRELEFVGIYRGKGVAQGNKSLTLSMVFRRADGTLRHEQVDEHQEKIMAILQKKFKAQLRS